MSALPFLVVHGAIVAKLLVGALAIGCLGLVRLSRRTLDAEEARHQLEQRRAHLAAPSEGVVTVRGTLHDTAVARWLDCAGERVELEGEFHVVRGTRARWRRRAATAEHSVMDGDDVIATGRMTRRIGGQDGYRDAPVAWIMTPAAGESASVTATSPAIELMASKPVVSTRRPGVVWLVLSVALSYGALYCVGTWVGPPPPEWKAGGWRPLPAPDSIREMSANSLAAALPGSRRQALDVLEAWLTGGLPLTSETVEQGIALAGLRGGWRAQADHLQALDLFERAYDVARGRDDRRALQALLALGRFSEAARIARSTFEIDRTDPLIGVALIAEEQWGDLAAIIDARVLQEELANFPHMSWSRLDAAGIATHRCVAEVLRSFGGDVHAVDRIRAIRRATGSAVCADLEPLAMGDLEGWVDRRLLAGRQGSQANALHFYGGSFAPWLAPHAGADSIERRKWMAVYHVYRSEIEDARRVLSALARASARDEELDLALQVASGEPFDVAHGLVSPQQLLDDRSIRLHATDQNHSLSWEISTVARAYSTRLRQRLLRPYSCVEDRSLAFWGAMAGHGHDLASYLRHCANISLLSPYLVLAAIPYVVHGRSELVDVAREYRVGAFFDRDDLAFATAHTAGLSAAFMRMTGHTALAERWQGIADRHAHMLASPERLIAVILWQVVLQGRPLDVREPS